MEVIKYLEEKELQRKDEISRQNLVKTNKKKDKLDITYVMVWTEICGGSKVLLEYMNRLSKRGHNITIVTYDKKPTWFPMEEKIKFIQVPLEKDIYEYISQTDLIVATSWKCIYEAIKSNKAPVVFFEQGGSHLFSKSELNKEKVEKLNYRYNMVSFIYTVSKYARNTIQKEYNVDSKVIPIAIDNSIFYNRKENKKGNTIEITAIGSEDFKFKNIDEIIKTVSDLKEKYKNIHFNWITQKVPKRNNIECIVNPEQKEIGNILRKTDIYVCASEYEAFGLPILEAMSCGATVVTTNTGGCTDFVKDNENALMIKKHNTKDMKEKIEKLINNEQLRYKLAKNGLETSKKFNWNNSVQLLEKYYQEIASYEINLKE